MLFTMSVAISASEIMSITQTRLRQSCHLPSLVLGSPAGHQVLHCRFINSLNEKEKKRKINTTQTQTIHFSTFSAMRQILSVTIYNKDIF